MAKSKVTKSKGSAPASYKSNTGYSIGVKGSEKTIGFYSEHTMGEKAHVSVVGRSQAHTTTKAAAHAIIAELSFKWPSSTYTMFKF